MSSKHSNKCAPESPRCTNCAQVMRLAGITSRSDDLPDLYKYECRSCGVSHVEPALSALKLDAIKDDQLFETLSLETLFGKLDALEGSHLLRGFRKRRWVH
jgi:MinD superfamily P-loop ATPase